MKCACGRTAVIFRRYEGRALCKIHFMDSIEKKVRETISREKLIERGDHLAVGVSGGKDSTLALYFMKKFAEEHPGLGLKVSAILIDEGVKGYRSVKPAEKIAKLIGAELTVASFKKEFGKTLDSIVAGSRKRRSRGDWEGRACTYCGVFRRHLLNKTARDLGATKLVIGHNSDDEAQSIMANYIRGDLLRSARLGAKAYIVKDKRFIPRIKPLRNIPEKETALYAILKGFPVDFSECPYASESFRWSMRDYLNDLEDKYPGTKHSIVANFDRMLPFMRKGFAGQKISSCTKCGEPTSGLECKVCALKEKMGCKAPINRGKP